MASRSPRCAGRHPRDAACTPDRGAQDRRPRRARLQQFFPRRQTGQRRRPPERGDAPAGLADHARGRSVARAGRRGARRRSRALFGDGDARDRESPAHPRRPRRSHEHSIQRQRRGTGHRRDRPADVGLALARRRRARRRRSSLFLRRDQPDRPRRVARHVESLSRLPLGAELSGTLNRDCPRGHSTGTVTVECPRAQLWSGRRGGGLPELSDGPGAVRRNFTTR